MSGTIIGIANAFGSSLTPGTAGQGQGPTPTPGADPMTFSVTPYNSGGTSTPSGQYQLGLYSTGTYNFTVNWGDGSSDDVITSYNQPEATHDYGTVTPADRFLITITPNTAFASSSFDHWFFGNRTQGDGLKVTGINLYGGVQFYANEDIFYGCEGLTTVNTSINNIPTFVNKDIIDSFFFKCTNLSVSFTLSYWVGPFTGTAIDFNGGTEVGLIPSGSSNGYFDFDFAPTSLLRAFENQASFNNQSLNNWDVSGSNDFSSAFEKCLRFNRPLPWTFQTGSPILATNMFKNAVDFNQDITAWDTSAFTHMDGMFARTLSIGGPVLASSFNQPIGSWNTNSVQDASAMFFNAEVFNQDLTNWFSTGALGSSSGGIGSMFAGASNFNGQVLNWDTSNITLFNFVFNRASAFNQDLSSWDTSSGVAFVSTFNDATSFNQDLSSWDVSMGLFFDEMFKGATSFLGTGIDSWNTASASSFSSMFNGASAFNQNLYSWDISNLSNASDMLTGTAISNDNWDSLLIGWGYAQQANLNNNVTLSDVPAQHGPGFVNAIFDKLTDSVANGGYGWTILDQGQSALPPPPLEFTIDTTATEAGSSANDQYRLPLMSTGTYNFYVDWGDGTIGDQITSWNQAEATHTYATAGTYIVQILATARVGQTPSVDHISWASQDGTTLTAANDRLKVQGIAKWGSAQVYLNEYVFTRCSNLDITTTALPNFGSKVLRTSAFENCDSLSGNLSGWGTVLSPITGFGALFYKDAASSNPNFNFVFQVGAGVLTQAFNYSTDFNNPLDNWDVSNARGFTGMFSSATSFNQDISGWDTGNSGAFNSMFNGASAFNQNISSWNVANVTTFSQMFQGATLFNQPVGAWTTTSLTNLFSTFKNAAAFDQDLANWDVSGVTTAVDMLTGSNISAANWDALLIGWAAQGTGAGSLQANVTLSNINQLHGSVDSAATAAYNKLTASPYNWTIVDLGGAPVGNLLLDTSYGSGAEAAYSVRKLRTAYTGPAMKVQDTVGGATQDIYFDANNNLDEAAIISYGGSNDVFVETWYDQSINGNDARQGTSARRPKIYDGTTGALVKRKGRIALDFLGTADIPLPTNSLPSNINNASSFLVYDFDTAAPLNVSYLALALGRNSPNQRWYTPFIYNSTGLEYFSYGNSLSGNVIKKPDDFVHLLTAIAGSTQGNASAFADGTITTTTSLQSAVPPEGAIGGFADSSNHYKGTMQEIVIYDSDKSSFRTDIEENIGDYFTQNTPLLDTYTGAAAAYSLRLLDSTYTGSAVQVQDTVGGATQDIGFNVFGELDTVALAAYGGSNEVRVVTWYDQSGNSNDATQGTSTSRSILYRDSSATVPGVVLSNGKPAVETVNSSINYSLPSGALPSNINNASSFITYGLTSASQGSTRIMAALGSPTNNARWYSPALNSSNEYFSYGSDFTTSNVLIGAADTNQHLLTGIAGSTQGNFSAFKDGALEFTETLSSAVPTAGYIGGNISAYFQEFVVYHSDESGNRAGIETNINTFYDIYTEPVAPLLLNNYPGAAAAYSLRRINSSYQGSAVLVQTTNNTKEPVYIGFDSNNDLDTVSLAAYGGSEEVVVAGWLDQSGNGNDAIQNSAASRPVIYRDSTATTPGVVLENGNPAVEFDGSDDNFTSTISNITQSFDVYTVHNFNTTPAATERLYDSDNGGRITRGSNGTSDNFAFAGTVLSWSPQQTGQVQETTVYNGVASLVRVNGTQTASGDAGTSSTGTDLVIGADRTASTHFIDGQIQELIIFDNSKSATDRTDIEENIGGYYDIPLPGLLDENPGAAAAYSLRRLRQAYTGSAIQVQRADNIGGTTDIGFDGYGNLDTAALTTAAAGNDMVVVTWYDQSGNSNDATQGTSTARPKIYDGTTGVVTEGSAGNEKPAVEFDGVSNELPTPTIFSDLGAGNAVSVFHISKCPDTTDGTVYNFSDSASANFFSFGYNFISGNYGSRRSIASGSNTFSGDTYNNAQSLFSQISTTTTNNQVYKDGTAATLTTTDGASRGNQSSNFIGSVSTSRFMKGNIQEIVSYTSDQSDNRPSIEDNVGDYYGIEIAGLLDQYSGAAAGYSLRKLSKSYTGFAIKVQDNVGGATQDIGFNADGELDTVALLAYAGSNDVFVETWYDQSGSGNNATQGSSAARPKIVSSGAVVVDNNGKPAVEFDGSNDILKQSGGLLNGLSSYSLFSTFNPLTSAGAYEAYLHQAVVTTPFNNTFQLRRDDANDRFNPISGQSLPLQNTVSSINNLQLLVSVLRNGATTNKIYQNGAFELDITANSYTINAGDFAIGGRSNDVNFSSMKAQEFVIYGNDQSDNRTGIEANINFFYDIY